MATLAKQKIVPHLWFPEKAAEAARFYASLFPHSGVDSVTTIPADTPSGPAGSVEVVEFTLAGQRFLALLENHPWFKVTTLAASANSAGVPSQAWRNGYTEYSSGLSQISRPES